LLQSVWDTRRRDGDVWAVSFSRQVRPSHQSSSWEPQTVALVKLPRSTDLRTIYSSKALENYRFSQQSCCWKLQTFALFKLLITTLSYQSSSWEPRFSCHERPGRGCHQHGRSRVPHWHVVNHWKVTPALRELQHANFLGIVIIILRLKFHDHFVL